MIIPNCDFNRPCDCTRCRTTYNHIKCPKCEFTNCVRVIRSSEYKVDRKGIGDYDFTTPKEPIKDLKCFKCGFLIKNVDYYSDVDNDANKRAIKREEKIKQGRICSECQKVEEMDFTAIFGNVVLKEKKGKKLCQGCYAKVMENEIPDPSNDAEKYSFDKRQLKWVLEKVKIPCSNCGKSRWLNAENHWKKLCLKCYKEKQK